MTTNTNITIHYGLTNSYTDITDIVFSTQLQFSELSTDPSLLTNVSGIIKIPAAESDRQLAFNGFMSGFENQIFIIQNGITTTYDNSADIYIDTTDITNPNAVYTIRSTDNNSVLPANWVMPTIVSAQETTNTITPASETIQETANTITSASETIPAPISDV